MDRWFATPSNLSRRLTADVTVNNSTTLIDTELALPVDANRVYFIEAFLIFEGTTVADAKFGLTAPSGASISWTRNALASTTTGTNAGISRDVVTSFATALVVGAAGAGAPAAAMPSGTLRTSAAGTITLQVAQNTAEATNTILRADSWLRLIRA